MSTIPSDKELSSNIAHVRSDQPNIGALKILALIKQHHPEWAVSEKRLRSSLRAQPESSTLVARTGLDASINTGDIAPNVEVRLFQRGKGKGLVAKSKILKGQVLWQEEPWIATADQQLRPLLSSKSMCTACLALFPSADPPLSKSCPSCHSVHFCNRLCLSRAKSSAAHHQLLCPATNPGCLELLKHIQDHGARHLEATARIIALWRGERSSNGAEAERIEMRIWTGMARINQLDKEKERREWPIVGEARMAELQHSHQLLVQALNPASDNPFFTRFQRALGPQKTLSQSETERWFSFDSYLDLLGLAGINQESSGGLYALHAHLNHSCEPNVQVRNLPKTFKPPTQLPCDLPPPNPTGVRGTNRLTMLARRDIDAGEELFISYINFGLPREQRRQDLRVEYGFWCQCGRCQSENP